MGLEGPLLRCCLCLNIFHRKPISHLIIYLLCFGLKHTRKDPRLSITGGNRITSDSSIYCRISQCWIHTCATLRSSFLRFCSAAALCFSHSSSFRRSCLNGHCPGIPGSFCFWAFLPNFLSSLAFFLWCSLTFLMTCAAKKVSQYQHRRVQSGHARCPKVSLTLYFCFKVVLLDFDFLLFFGIALHTVRRPVTALRRSRFSTGLSQPL